MTKPDNQSCAHNRPLTVKVKGSAGVAIARAMLAAFRPHREKDAAGGGNG